MNNTATIESTLNTAVNTAVNSTASIANSIGTATMGAANSTFNAFNSLGKSTMNAVNSTATTVSNIANATANNFTNVNNSSRANNNSYRAANNSSSSGTSLSTLFGVILFLVAIFLIVMIVFKDQLTVAWNYIKFSLQNLFNMHPPNNRTAEEDAAIKAGEIESPMPGTLDATYQAKKDETNIINKVLPTGVKEVFNVSSNEYSYYDAEPLCRALGAELATYSQVKSAWSNGADWCNYGWTKGQVAIYPTQKETWEKLQGGPPDEHTACGEPGVNGGFFDNPEMKFGVNCYGVKPEQSANDERLLMENGTIPKTVSTLKIDQQIQDIKNNVDMIGVLPFSSKKWSTS